MAPILKLVLFWAQSQHGLCVDVEFVVKVVQECGPRPVLEGKSRGAMELTLWAWVRPLPGGSTHLATCSPTTVWTQGQAGVHAHN